MQVGLSVGHLYVVSLGGVTGVGGDSSLPLNGVRDKTKVSVAELGKPGFYILVTVFFIYIVFSYFYSI